MSSIQALNIVDAAYKLFIDNLVIGELFVIIDVYHFRVIVSSFSGYYGNLTSDIN